MEGGRGGVGIGMECLSHRKEKGWVGEWVEGGSGMKSNSALEHCKYLVLEWGWVFHNSNVFCI